MYSGGGEGVMCRWRQEGGSKPSFIPRLGGPLLGMTSGAEVSVLQLENNLVKIVDTMSDKVLASVSGKYSLLIC